MKKLLALTLALTLTPFAVPNGVAAMFGIQILELDFKNPVEITKKARWSNPDKLDLKNGGLGFDGESAQAVDISLETIEPFAIGYSWRPAQAAQIDIEITPWPKAITLANGQTFSPTNGNFYVRYSPDARHWSSWQAIDDVTVPGKGSQRRFRGRVGVPQKEREPYQNYLYSYYRLDVPWTSDEEAAVKWILKKDPDFFAKHIPFIGYLQFLFESQLYGKQRIEGIKISIGYGVSGLATIPKDKKVQEGRDNVPWRFQSK